MRIAFLAYRGNMKSGGQGLYLHAITRALVERGHTVDVFVGPPYPDAMPWADGYTEIENHEFWATRFDKAPGAFLPDGDPFRILRPLNFFEYAVTRFGFFPEMFAFSMRAASAVVARIRAGTRYDLVHDVQSLSYGLLWLRSLGLPVVATIHHPLTVDLRSSLARDTSFTERKGSLTFYPVRSQRRVARRLDAILTSSDASADEIVSGFGVRRDRVHNVLNGVDLPPPGAIRERPARRELLFVGRGGDPNKGLEFLVSALAMLPHDVELRVLDAFPALTPIERQLTELRVRDRVHFVGKLPREAFEAELRNASIVVIPSLFEGFGLPAVEALACGTPVVATHTGAAARVAEIAGTGTLVTPGDAAALAKAIEETFSGWPEKQRAAVAARAHLERVFGWPEIAASTERVYDAVARERRAA